MTIDPAALGLLAGFWLGYLVARLRRRNRRR